MHRIKKICHHILFYFLLLLGIGQLPTHIGLYLLVIAVLLAPFQRVRHLVDWYLELYSKRELCTFFFFMMILCLPEEIFMEAFEYLGLRIGRILRFLGISPGA